MINFIIALLNRQYHHLVLACKHEYS